MFSNQYAFPLLHVGMTGVDDLSESLMAPPDVVDARSSAVAKKKKEHCVRNRRSWYDQVHYQR